MMKAKNPTPEIMVRFKGAGQTRVYRPKDTVQGIVEINPQRDIKCRAVEIKVGWHTEGRGTRAEGYPYLNRRDDVTELSMMQPFIGEFSFVIPSKPWSYSGHYVSIVWSVEVKIDIARGRDITHSEPFVMQP
jgi:hypothetical protein